MVGVGVVGVAVVKLSVVPLVVVTPLQELVEDVSELQSTKSNVQIAASA
eukprot:CAMPEP_0202702748 /NCGR_PEP_ID=MMETSP1385-20130828/15686_1 /ASSEMBLY_ACC=CAM_ASM_000861 /TAXON_ID=933848 /ORGANISM="Elphidium margaritaceum" /LENGTH=48 /DNA_ID= /DNA_START= /DNA_END= /DNA_ORIENTATION=